MLGTHRADLDTIFDRLLARNEQLDREVDSLLQRFGIATDEELLRRIERERRDAGEAWTEIQKRTMAGFAEDSASWERLGRPSLSELHETRGAALLRV